MHSTCHPAPIQCHARTAGLIEIKHAKTTAAAAASYERLHARAELGRPARFWRWILDLCELRPGQRLLDIACGNGQLARAAAAQGVDVWAVDLSRQALAAFPSCSAADRPASSRPTPTGARARPVRADGQRLPFPDGTFDTVAHIGSLEHFEDPCSGAREVARVLAPSGRAVILVPNSFGWRGMVLHAWRSGEVIDDGQPIQRYGTPGQWARLLLSCGLHPKRVAGCESLIPWPRGAADGLAWARHPSRWLIPLNRWLPASMAAELVFVCSRGDTATGSGQAPRKMAVA